MTLTSHTQEFQISNQQVISEVIFNAWLYVNFLHLQDVFLTLSEGNHAWILFEEGSFEKGSV